MRLKQFFLGTGMIALAAIAASAVFAPGAKADEIATLTTTTCGSSTCPLATYTVDVKSTGGNAYTVTLDISVDPSATIISGTDNDIQSVDVKFDTDLATAVLDTGASSGIGAGWTTSPNVSLNNNDCTGSGSGFICSQDAGSGLAITQGGDYKWVWDVTAASDATFTDTVHIGANYNPANGYILSQDVQDVSTPEPGTLALLGFGLAGLVMFRRKVTA